MIIKKLLNITDQQANAVATAISISSEQRNALVGKKIMKKLTAETTYTEITILQAINILKTNNSNYGQGLVNRLVTGEIIYYPDGEIKLDTTQKCDICYSGYIGEGTVSTIDSTKTLCPSCARAEVFQQVIDATV